MSGATLSRAKQRTGSRDGVKTYCQFSAVTSIFIVGLILVTLLIQSGPVLLADNNGLLGTHWNPDEGLYGVLPMLFGSVFVMLIATSMAFPIGLMTAIYISETRSSKLRRFYKSILELLAGIPSIVYGLIGVAYLNIWVADAFDLQSGRIILTAGILLGIMILPTFLTLSEDAISSVPLKFRENAKSLGLYRHEIFKKVILPQAKSGIAGAGLLALGRALGETMAVMLVIGSLDRLPSPLFNPLSSGQTITSKLGREVGESAFGSVHFSALVFMSLILVCITIALTILSQYYLTRKGDHV